jgi:uncharacterized phage protein (TIGR02220 family)
VATSVSSGSPQLEEFKLKVDANAAAANQERQARKPKPPAFASGELELVSRVLEKLTAHNGTQYRNGGIAHAKAILSLVADGATEEEIRAVIGYCAEVKRWKYEPRDGEKDMRPYLQPATLFAKTNFFEKYRDPAMAWANRLPDARPNPLTEIRNIPLL